MNTQPFKIGEIVKSRDNDGYWVIINIETIYLHNGVNFLRYNCEKLMTNDFNLSKPVRKIDIDYLRKVNIEKLKIKKNNLENLIKKLEIGV